MSCVFYDEKHDSSECYRAKGMTLEERQRCVKVKGGCFKCLKLGHGFKSCFYNQKCPWCGKKHVLLMCREVDQRKAVSSVNCAEDRENIVEAGLTSVLKSPKVFLQTLRVKLRNGEREIFVRAVLDSCAHRSYVLESTAKKMNYQTLGKQKMIHLLFGGLKTEHQGYRIFVSGVNRASEYNFVVLSKGMIVDEIPSIEDGPWIGELKQREILLSDVDQTNEPVSLLIGADVIGKLQTGNMFDLKSGPTAIETRLGWTLIGKRRQEEISNVDTALVVTSLLIKEVDVSQLWSLDVLGIKDHMEPDSKEAHKIKTELRIRGSVRIDEKERYEVRLPWKENHPAQATKYLQKRDWSRFLRI